MLDAYDFRARTLWPELGRFGQEDPAGTASGANLYEALNGNWSDFVDPNGLWEEDVHHYLTWFLARKAGFGEAEASRLGAQTGALDYDERDAMTPPVSLRSLAQGSVGNRRNYELYHFVTSKRLDSMKEQAGRAASDVLSGELETRWRDMGEYLHAFEDSFSHQKNKTSRDMFETYGLCWGHAFAGPSITI